jgi:Tol biopolymer transport system component
VSARLVAALDGQYKIIREAGAGGMATVYLAEDLKHGRQVALKVLRPELAATLGPVRFFREIQVAARLQHPHILPLHDSGEADGFLYYVMPFVDGESLRERLARVGELPIHDAVKILMEVVDALAYAHSQGVVHRDIKPDNVMLSGRHALVTDFGVAKAVSEATGKNQLTTAGVALGTPAYMAPEQAAADPHLDHRVDIYAVGAMGYELLTGRPPFIGMTPQQVLAAHVTQAPDPVSRYRAAVPAALETVLMRCLAKRASDRWQSAEELLQNLEPLATPSGGMTPTSTRPIQGVTLASTPTGRRWVTGAAVAVVAIIGTLGWFAFRDRAVQRIQPDRVQVTSTGNTNTPALSPDGQRLAYSTRQCTAEGYCTFDLMVQDVGGAGVSTVLRGWASIWQMQWSDDARFILVNGFEGTAGRWGPFSVPSLGGGTPRWLGCCTAHVGSDNTAIVSRSFSGDSIEWILRVPLTDGIPRDSFSTPHRAGSPAIAWPVGSDGRILLVREEGSIGHLATVESDGRMIDSVTLALDRVNWGSVETIRGERDFVVARPQEGGLGEYDLLRFRIDAEGRIGREADTILTGLSGWFSTEPNGMLATATGASSWEVWSMTRAGGTAMGFTQRRLASATAPIGGAVDPSGKWVALWRRVVVGGKALIQLSVIPADSGPERLVGPPRQIADYWWAQEGGALAVAVADGDTIRISLQDVETGRSRPITEVPKRNFGLMTTVSGGGVAIGTPDRSRIHLRGIPGRADTTFVLPESEGTVGEFSSSPDGKSLVANGWDRNYDSLVVRRIDLTTLRATRLWAEYSDGGQLPTWLEDGSIIVPVKENASTLVWYRIPAAGGRAVRLGTPPRAADATFRMSRDGRRVIARVNTNGRDIFLVRNFRQLLGE